MNNFESPIAVRVKALGHYDHQFPLPLYESKGAAGADVRAHFENREPMTISPEERVLIPTGICLEIPEGFEIQVRPRSGLSFKTGLMVLNSPGTIDSDYRGEVKIILGNLSKNPVTIAHGDRVAQLVLAPVYKADFIFSERELEFTERGEKGFGSTGIN